MKGTKYMARGGASGSAKPKGTKYMARGGASGAVKGTKYMARGGSALASEMAANPGFSNIPKSVRDKL